ncbi:MAG: bifunctional riboflavin kinase/FAD synthetase [Saezia sp.]
MQVFRGIHHHSIAPKCVLTIGNFDGVHRGHQAMLSSLASEARQRGVAATVLTFEPHPIEYLAPQRAPARISRLRDKLSEFKLCGIDQVIVLRFDERLACLSADDFIKQVVVDGLHAQHVLVGDDFKFGAKRLGDYDYLNQLAPRYGFDTARMNSFEVGGQRVSSSLVRQALQEGSMQQANLLLGRPYYISGHVVHGRKLGRELGFRTLNIRFGHQNCAASGIFVGSVLGLENKPLPAVLSVGIRPTVDSSKEVLVEAHVFDWWGNAYGEVVRVELLHKLRDEVKFPSLEALKDGIAKDCEQARAFWQSYLHEQARLVNPLLK